MTDRIGIGAQPAGTTPAAFGVAPTLTALGGVLYVEPPQATTGTGRFIDPATRQYVIDPATGRPRGMETVPQLVQLAVSSVNWSTIDVIGPNHPKRCEALLADVLAGPIDRRLLEIVRVETNRVGASGTEVVLVWRDLTTATERRTRA
jgi:hypothetical protein